MNYSQTNSPSNLPSGYNSLQNSTDQYQRQTRGASSLSPADRGSSQLNHLTRSMQRDTVENSIDRDRQGSTNGREQKFYNNQDIISIYGIEPLMQIAPDTWKNIPFPIIQAFKLLIDTQIQAFHRIHQQGDTTEEIRKKQSQQLKRMEMELSKKDGRMVAMNDRLEKNIQKTFNVFRVECENQFQQNEEKIGEMSLESKSYIQESQKKLSNVDESDVLKKWVVDLVRNRTNTLDSQITDNQKAIQEQIDNIFQNHLTVFGLIDESAKFKSISQYIKHTHFQQKQQVESLESTQGELAKLKQQLDEFCNDSMPSRLLEITESQAQISTHLKELEKETVHEFMPKYQQIVEQIQRQFEHQQVDIKVKMGLQSDQISTNLSLIDKYILQVNKIKEETASKSRDAIQYTELHLQKIQDSIGNIQKNINTQNQDFSGKLRSLSNMVSNTDNKVKVQSDRFEKMNSYSSMYEKDQLVGLSVQSDIQDSSVASQDPPDLDQQTTGQDKEQQEDDQELGQKVNRSVSDKGVTQGLRINEQSQNLPEDQLEDQEVAATDLHQPHEKQSQEVRESFVSFKPANRAQFKSQKPQKPKGTSSMARALTLKIDQNCKMVHDCTRLVADLIDFLVSQGQSSQSASAPKEEKPDLEALKRRSSFIIQQTSAPSSREAYQKTEFGHSQHDQSFFSNNSASKLQNIQMHPNQHQDQMEDYSENIEYSDYKLQDLDYKASHKQNPFSYKSKDSNGSNNEAHEKRAKSDINYAQSLDQQRIMAPDSYQTDNFQDNGQQNRKKMRQQVKLSRKKSVDNSSIVEEDTDRLPPLNPINQSSRQREDIQASNARQGSARQRDKQLHLNEQMTKGQSPNLPAQPLSVKYQGIRGIDKAFKQHIKNNKL